jgi:beta-galactosidase
VHPEEVVQNKLGAYKILFLPYPVMLSKEVAEGVKRYVENGGTAVAEARLAWNDERGFASNVIPGFELAQVFGAKEKVIRPVEKAALRLKTSSGLPGVNATDSPSGEAFEEDLEPLGKAHVLAQFSNGEPAIIENHYGKGRAILIGSFLALHSERHPEDAATRRLLVALARSGGVAAEVEVSGAGTKEVEIRRLVGDQIQILFAFNHSQQAADPTIALRSPWPVKSARDVEDDHAVTVVTRGGNTILHQALAPGAIWVVRLERQ